MSGEHDRHVEQVNKMKNDLPGPIKVLIVGGPTAAGLVLMGIPGAVAGFTVGEFVLLVIRLKETHQK